MRYEFRGKTLDSDWVYGVPVYQNNRCFIISGAADWDEDFFQPEKWNPVNPKTVGQFTGLLDKESNKIFEGDIVRFRANYSSAPCGDMLAEVVLTEYRLELHSKNGYIYDAQEETDEFPYQHCKILGNIHDNPELLQ